MNRTETSALLTVISRIDNRIVDRELVEAWTDLLDDIRLDDALTAARDHLRSDERWLTPAILRGRIRQAKSVHRPVGDVLREAEGDPERIRRADEIDFGEFFPRPE